MWWEIENHLKATDDDVLIGSNFSVNQLYEMVNEIDIPRAIYIYNSHRANENIMRITNAFDDNRFLIRYAMKANPEPHFLSAASDCGADIDAVSLGEVERALDAGFEPSEILYTGVGTHDLVFDKLVKKGIPINVDDIGELEPIAYYCDKHNVERANAVRSVRWNPGKGAGFSAKCITAGDTAHGIPIKFGVSEDEIMEVYEEAVRMDFKPKGLMQHIGSGWRGDDVNEFLETVDGTLAMAKRISYITPITEIDFGGGPGIPYKPEDEEFPLKDYADGIKERVNNSGLDLKLFAIEPGRYIVGDTGVYVVEVTRVKKRGNDTIVLVNGGFNHLIRPAMYAEHSITPDGEEVTEECYHHAVNCSRPFADDTVPTTIAGNLCETGDVLALRRPMPECRVGDKIMFLNAGAYGYDMAPHGGGHNTGYNSQGAPEKVFVWLL